MMDWKKIRMLLILFTCLAMLLTACGEKKKPEPAKAPESAPFVFGVILVGPYNDHGWSEAHYMGGKYAESKIPNAKMIYVDNVNPGAKPGVTIPQVAEDLISKGAKIIFTTSDDFKDGTLEAAKKYPNIPFVNVSGDHAWKEGKDYKAPNNLSNFMGRVEYGKMIAGCAAALTTQTGKIGYLGPLINDETRRLAVSAYLGAKYAWTNILKKDPKKLKFKGPGSASGSIFWGRPLTRRKWLLTFTKAVMMS